MLDVTEQFLLSVPYYDLFITALVLLVTVAVMIYYRLEIVVESLIGFGRSLIQLVLMAGILLMFFRLDHLYLNLALVAFMVLVAGLTAADQSPMDGALGISLFSQAVAAGFTLIPTTLLGVIDLKASFFIPIAAMLVRNTLDRASLSFERLDREMKQNRDLVEQQMALGIDPSTASSELIRESIEASMIPSLNKLKVVGLVGLPGLMTGMILTADPGELTGTLAYAASLQAIILYLIFAGSIVASVLVCTLMRGRYFNRRHQLIFEEGTSS